MVTLSSARAAVIDFGVGDKNSLSCFIISVVRDFMIINYMGGEFLFWLPNAYAAGPLILSHWRVKSAGLILMAIWFLHYLGPVGCRRNISPPSVTTKPKVITYMHAVNKHFLCLYAPELDSSERILTLMKFGLTTDTIFSSAVIIRTLGGDSWFIPSLRFFLRKFTQLAASVKNIFELNFSEMYWLNVLRVEPSKGHLGILFADLSSKLNSSSHEKDSLIYGFVSVTNIVGWSI